VGSPGWTRAHPRCATVNVERHEVGSVVCVRDTDMKQAWFLATKSTDETARDLIRFYGVR
jgi:hypothetical protein